MHLRWLLEGTHDAAEVTLEVVEAPAVAELYFWALQVDLGAGGGAHLGLQWHPSHPGATAVNWGGYDRSGGELTGSSSELPSATGNPNTRDLHWAPGRPHRLLVERVGVLGDGRTAWRGSVGVDDAPPVVVRDLFAAGDAITGVVMWSEVFARCDDPPVSVRWSDPVARRGPLRHEPTGLAVSYQSQRDGGCANTTAIGVGDGVIQRTSSDRVTAQGAVLPVRGGSG
jgi:hypothetical protein